MNIDWFTFIAQIVNFLVLVALLRWFLYDPIVRAMQQREDDMTSRRQQAIDSQEAAEAKVDEYEARILQIEEQREDLMKEARFDAHSERERILKEARDQVEHKRAEWLQAFQRERGDLTNEIRQQTGQLATAAARQFLVELSDASLEEQILHVFNTRLRLLDQRERETIASHLGNGTDDVLVRSTFDVPERGRGQLRDTIRETFGYDADVSFEKAAGMICGIELRVGGYSFAWNADEFLKRVEEDFQKRSRKSSI